MTLYPKYFPDVGSPMNLELSKDASTGICTEVVILYLSEKMDHRVSYNWGLVVGWSLLFPDLSLEYCMEGCCLLYIRIEVARLGGGLEECEVVSMVLVGIIEARRSPSV